MGKRVNIPSYKEAYKKIAPFVDIKIDLRKKLQRKDKWLISYYFNKLRDLHAIDREGNYKNVTFYKPRSKNKLAKLKKQYGVKSKRLKIVPIPQKTIEKGSGVKLTRYGSYFKSKNMIKKLIAFSNKDLQRAYKNDRLNEFVAKLLKPHPLKKSSDYYSIKTFQYETGKAKDVGAVAVILNDLLATPSDQYKELKINIDGIYHNSFINQRAPTKSEVKKSNGKRKKKNSRRRLRD